MLSKRYKQSAKWLVNLRWIAIFFVIVTNLIVDEFIQIPVQSFKIYILAIALLMFNIFYYYLIKNEKYLVGKSLTKTIKLIINIQISIDLIILTLLLHYSGGVENPFIIVYIFHMILASIILSERESFMQTSLAILLTGLLTISEYFEIIPHFSLVGFVDSHIYQNSIYLIFTGIVFVFISYTVWYMTTYITRQLREHAKALSDANQKLKKQDKIKNEYVLRVTHDIKGHLATIHSSLGVLTMNIFGEVSAKHEEFIKRAYNRTIVLASFVRDLLNLTRMRMGDTIDMDHFSIAESIQKIWPNLENNANAKLIELNKTIDNSINLIYGNKFSFEELISNLILNAIKYTPEKGKVNFKGVKQRKYFHFEVSDTGIGIPSDEKNKIFDEFYRAKNAKKHSSEGSGTGLSLVKIIVGRHGGKIWVEDNKGAGSTFKFTIPIKTQNQRKE